MGVRKPTLYDRHVYRYADEFQALGRPARSLRAYFKFRSRLMTQKTWIVTGGAGFIGANLVHLLAQRRPDVRLIVVDKLTYAGNRGYLKGVEDGARVVFEQVDIADEAEVERLFVQYRPTGVFHLAAESHVDRSISGPRPFIDSNIIGTYVLLEAARRHWLERGVQGRFLHVSTDEVYGDLGPNDPAFTEETPYRPSSPYSASKAASDHLATAWHRTYGLDVVITNCSNNFGPFQYPEKLIPVVIRNIRDRKAIPLYGDGSNVRDWLYVVDHAEAILTAFEKGVSGRNYNIGTQNEWENKSLVELLCDLVDQQLGTTDSRALIEFVSDRPGHDRRYAIDPTRTKAELGWEPRFRFEEAMEQTVAWYLANLQPMWGV